VGVYGVKQAKSLLIELRVVG